MIRNQQRACIAPSRPSNCRRHGQAISHEAILKLGGMPRQALLMQAIGRQTWLHKIECGLSGCHHAESLQACMTFEPDAAKRGRLLYS